MQWRICSPEDKELFNNYLRLSPKGHILQSWQWGEVKKISGWQPLRIIVEDEGNVVGVCSLLKRKLPLCFGQSFLCSKRSRS